MCPIESGSTLMRCFIAGNLCSYVLQSNHWNPFKEGSEVYETGFCGKYSFPYVQKFVISSSIGCPNSCFELLGHGNCSVQSTCECNPGWTGLDCSLGMIVLCSIFDKNFVVECTTGKQNDCNNQGSCGTIKGIDTCICDPSSSLNDCSGIVGKWLNIVFSWFLFRRLAWYCTNN